MKPQLRNKSFRSNEGGNVAMIFALALLPLLLVAGFAIDAQLAFSKQGKIQRAVDSAVLAGARMMQSVDDEAEVRKHARSYFSAIMEGEPSSLRCDTLDISFTGPEELQGTVTCHQPTTLMRLAGHNEVDIQTTGTATYGTGRLDVSFVFDVSGSMNNEGRIYDLKTAAKDAAETLLPEPGSASDGDVRIAMIGYNRMVNAGKYFEDVTGLKEFRTYEGEDTYETTEKTNKNGWHQECEYYCRASWRGYCYSWGQQCEWVNGPYQEEEDVQTTKKTDIKIRSTCVYERDGDHAFDNRQPKQLKTSDVLTKMDSGTYNARDDEENSDAYMTAAHAEWRDYNDEDEGGDWKVWGKQSENPYGSDLCPDSAPPFGLSHNKTQINHYIDGLRAGGGTAGHQGIAWGWYMISDTWSDVFKGSETPLDKSEPDVVKAMIVMTDGAFNEQFHNDLGNSNDQAEKMCDAIKADDVIVYTVAFQAPDAGKEILAYCASGPEFYFNADNGQELVESYRAIATSISDLRISH